MGLLTSVTCARAWWPAQGQGPRAAALPGGHLKWFGVKGLDSPVRAAAAFPALLRGSLAVVPQRLSPTHRASSSEDSRAKGVSPGSPQSAVVALSLVLLQMAVPPGVKADTPSGSLPVGTSRTAASSPAGCPGPEVEKGSLSVGGRGGVRGLGDQNGAVGVPR